MVDETLEEGLKDVEVESTNVEAELGPYAPNCILRDKCKEEKTECRNYHNHGECKIYQWGR